MKTTKNCNKTQQKTNMSPAGGGVRRTGVEHSRWKMFVAHVLSPSLASSTYHLQWGTKNRPWKTATKRNKNEQKETGTAQQLIEAIEYIANEIKEK